MGVTAIHASRCEVTGNVQDQLRDAGSKGVGLAINVGHDRHVRGDRPVHGIQRGDPGLAFGVRPQGQIAKLTYRHHRRIEHIGLRRAGRGTDAVHHIHRKFSAERAVPFTCVDHPARWDRI